MKNVFSMNTPLSLSGRNRSVADSKSPLNIVVAYADRLTHCIAMGVCSRMVRRIHRAFDVHVFWWSFDTLSQRDALEHAASIAARADMIFCSVHASNELPAPAKVWADHWLAQTRRTDGALVALLKTTGPADGAPLPAEVHLSALARAAHMDFFVKVFDRPVHETSSFNLSRTAKQASHYHEAPITEQQMATLEQYRARDWEGISREPAY